MRPFAGLILVGATVASLLGCASFPAAPGVMSKEGLAGIPIGERLIGPDTANVTFAVSPGGIGRMVGVFNEFDAVLHLDDPIAGKARLTAEVDTTSVELKNAQFQDIVASPAWFDIENYPRAHFNGALEGWGDDGVGRLSGQMTIRDVTRDEVMELRLTCEDVSGCPVDAVGFQGELKLSRTAYGMTAMRGMVSDQVTLVVHGKINVSAD